MATNGLTYTTDVLKRVRKEKGLTQKDVARMVGVNQSVISRIEAGEISASNKIAEGLEDVYGLPIVDALLYRKSWPGEPQDVTEIKQLIDRYQTVLSESGISAIKAYVQHIVGLSNESSFTAEGPKIPKQSLRGGDWSWGPREMERYITSECAPVRTWNRISIHRTYPIKVKGEEVVKEIKQLGRKAFLFQGSVANRSQNETMIQETLERLGRLDIMVANAAFSVRKPFLELEVEDVEKTWGVSLWGVFHCCQQI